jgi:uncharacterized membrane protein YeiH
MVGVFMYAISGSLTAMSKKLDPFGVFIIAFVASVGGGTLRDVLIGREPVFWMSDTIYFYIIIAGVVLAIVLRRKIDIIRRTLLLFDTFGLAIFTIVGIKVGILFGLDDIIIISLGVMTGSFGGVIRDILVNEIPVIFHKEIYATTSVIGSMVYITGDHFGFDPVYNTVLSIGVIVVIRTIVVKKHLTLPSFY